MTEESCKKQLNEELENNVCIANINKLALYFAQILVDMWWNRMIQKQIIFF